MKYKKLFLIMFSVMLVVFSITGSVAYYRFSFESKVNVSTGNAVFNVTGLNLDATTQKINLGSNLKPGDSGTISVTLDSTGSESSMYATFEINRIVLPDNLKFYSDSNHMSVLNKYFSFLELGVKSSDSFTIYWYWDPNGSDEDDNKYINATLSAEFSVSAVQISEYAVMKNGASNDESMNGGTEFWNNTYKPYIRTIKFINNLSNLPVSCTEENLCWDISSSSTQKNKVYGYLVDSGLKDKTDSSKALYNLFIASDTPIFAPSDCYMLFYSFKNLISIDFNENFNTSNVVTMASMFCNCISLTSLDLSNFNTSKVTNMGNTFSICSSLTNLDLSSFNTKNVVDMWHMFTNCPLLVSLDLSNFDTSNVTTMEAMFGECITLTTTINIMNSNITDYKSMFYNAATASGSKITVNYVEGASTLVDNMIATKSSNSNVVKGKVFAE